MIPRVPSVTVALPVWSTPQPLVERAIAAVRAQTFTDWRLVVVGDGDHLVLPEAARTDRRVTLLNLGTNSGRYYCDAVVFTASDSPWFAVHDSDDAARPDWLATLVALAEARNADAALGAQCVHRFGGSTATDYVQGWGVGRTRLTHHSHMAGVWRRSWLASVGGPHPAFRVGFDSLLTSLPYLAGSLAATDRVLYDRYKRTYSLTTDVKTGMRSEYRRKVRADLERLYSEILAVDGDRYLINQVLSAYPNPSAYADLRACVERDAATLRALLESAR